MPKRRLAAYSISCFPAAFSRRFRYPNPSPQAFPFSLPAAALLPRPLHSDCIRQSPFLRSGRFVVSSFQGSTTADHSAVMAGRSLAEPSLRSATDDDVSAVPSTTTSAARGVSAQDEGPASGVLVLVECRICQEDGDEACMEAPCSCKGSLKVQRVIGRHANPILVRFSNCFFWGSEGRKVPGTRTFGGLI